MHTGKGRVSTRRGRDERDDEVGEKRREEERGGEKWEMREKGRGEDASMFHRSGSNHQPHGLSVVVTNFNRIINMAHTQRAEAKEWSEHVRTANTGEPEGNEQRKERGKKKEKEGEREERMAETM